MFTFVKESNGKIFMSGYDKQGKKYYEQDAHFKPYIFIRGKTSEQFQSFPDFKPLGKIEFQTIDEMKQSLQVYPKDKVEGNIKHLPIIQKIRKEKHSEDFDMTKLRVFFFDIETFYLNGFASPNRTEGEIISISLVERDTDNVFLWFLSGDFEFSSFKWFQNKFYDDTKNFESLKEIKSFGIQRLQKICIEKTKDEINKLNLIIEEKQKTFDTNISLKEEFDFFRDYVEEELKRIKKLETKISWLMTMEKSFRRALSIKTYQFSDEADLLSHFCEFVGSSKIDIISGFNSDMYDIPYIVNRSRKIIGDNLKKISPFKYIRKKKEITDYGEEIESADIMGISHFDYMKLDKTYTQNHPKRGLNEMAFDVLGWGKLDHGDESLNELWLRDKQKFLEYNLLDSELLDSVDAVYGYINHCMGTAHYCGTTPEVYEHATYLWEAIWYNHFLDMGLVIPSAKENTGREESIKGAYVKEPILGLKKWVISGDLDSLYTSMQITMNMSHETIIRKDNLGDLEEVIEKFVEEKFDFEPYKKNNCCVTPNGMVFSKNKEGIIPSKLKQMKQHRKETKKESERFKDLFEKETEILKKEEYFKKYKNLNGIQNYEKVLLNSFYGALQVGSFALHNRDYAEAITTMSQVANKFCMKKTNIFIRNCVKEQNQVDYCIGGDTDSNYYEVTCFVDMMHDKLKTDEEIVEYLDNVCKKAIFPNIVKIYQNLIDYTGAYTNALNMKREVIAKGIFWKAKKFYCGMIYDNEGIRYKIPKMKVVGIKIVRSDTPKAVKPILKDFLERLLLGGNIKRYVNKQKKEILSWSPDKIAQPMNTKVLNDYYEDTGTINCYKKGAGYVIKGAWRYNWLIHYLKLSNKYPIIKQGDKCKFVYLKENNPWRIEGISFLDKLPKEFNLENYVDNKSMYEKIAGKFFVDMLEVVGMKELLEDNYNFDLF